MDLAEALRRRRSVRRFRSDPVPEDALQRVLEAAHAAPSGCNRQPWLFVVVTDEGERAWIRERCEEVEQKTHSGAAPWFRAFLQGSGLTPEKSFLTDAPLLILVFGERGTPYWKASTWIAIGYMVLAAAAEGLGSLTYTPGKLRGIRGRLGVAHRFVLQAVLPLGRPADEPAQRPRRRPLDEVLVRR